MELKLLSIKTEKHKDNDDDTRMSLEANKHLAVKK
jgi:hypothetical protein